MFKIYFTNDIGAACSEDREDLREALQVCEGLRKAGCTFVTMVSENPNHVGKPGVDSVENGKLPSGEEYSYIKKNRVPRFPSVLNTDDETLHTCPYKVELFDDHQSMCDCDEESTRNCADDI